MNTLVSEKNFRKVLAKKIGPENLDWPVAVFQKCGPLLSWDIATLLLHAADQGRETFRYVVGVLEYHYETHLQYQHPESRDFDAKTQKILGHICKKLGLKVLKPFSRIKN